MPTRFVFTFHGDTQVDRTLTTLSQHASDARPAWQAMAARMQRAETRQFATQGAAASGGWAPLSPRYAAWKARHYPGRPILQRTGELAASLTARPFGVEVIEPHAMALGTDVPYAKYHQHGTEKMPRRRPLELTEAERRAWVRILQRWIVRGQVAP